MRDVMTFLVITALGVAAPAAANDDLTTRPAGAVLRVQGDIFVSRAGLRTELPQGARVFMGEHVRGRGADARVDLRMVDGARLLLGGETDFQLNRYLYEPDFAVGEIAVQIYSGVARYRAGEIAADDALLVATPFGDVEAQGVDFWMRALDSRLEIGVFEQGELTVSNGAGAVTIDEPFAFTVVWSFAEPPQSPLKLARSAIADLYRALAHAEDPPPVDPDDGPPLGPESPGPDSLAASLAPQTAPPAALWRPLREVLAEQEAEGEEAERSDEAFDDESFDFDAAIPEDAAAIDDAILEDDAPADDDLLSGPMGGAPAAPDGDDAFAVDDPGAAGLAPPDDFLSSSIDDGVAPDTPPDTPRVAPLDTPRVAPPSPAVAPRAAPRREDGPADPSPRTPPPSSQPARTEASDPPRGGPPTASDLSDFFEGR